MILVLTEQTQATDFSEDHSLLYQYQIKAAKKEAG